MNLKKGIEAIEKKGILLVYPLHNKEEPSSLWSEFYPRSKMRWEWDSGGDNRVAGLWHLREELSRSKKVVYAKWYKGRATFFSREVFKQLFTLLSSPVTLNPKSRHLLGYLLEDSPLSTKQLKKRVKEEGAFEEKTYEKSLKELWRHLLVVGFGEVDDGAFPSLAVGATEVLFEELTKPVKDADVLLEKKLGRENLFFKEFLKVYSTILSQESETKQKRKKVFGRDLQASN